QRRGDLRELQHLALVAKAQPPAVPQTCLAGGEAAGAAERAGRGGGAALLELPQHAAQAKPSGPVAAADRQRDREPREGRRRQRDRMWRSRRGGWIRPDTFGPRAPRRAGGRRRLLAPRFHACVYARSRQNVARVPVTEWAAGARAGGGAVGGAPRGHGSGAP